MCQAVAEVLTVNMLTLNYQIVNGPTTYTSDALSHRNAYEDILMLKHKDVVSSILVIKKNTDAH